MLFEIMLSLRLYLSEQIPEATKVQMIYDGVSLKGLDKPFITLEDYATPMSLMAAGRKSYSETYNIQLGVFAEDYEGRLLLQEKVKTALLGNPIPLYDETFTLTDQSFYCEMSDFTPIGSDDMADDTNKFRAYADVSVEILRDIGSKEFTQ